MEVIVIVPNLNAWFSLVQYTVVAIRVDVVDVSPIGRDESQGCYDACRSETVFGQSTTSAEMTPGHLQARGPVTGETSFAPQHRNTLGFIAAMGVVTTSTV